jgi:hypothetical protein
MTIQDWINWHRIIGVIATVLILVLVITGLALNHINDLRLDEIYIENGTLLDWYGIAPEKALISYTAGNHRITQIDSRLYLNETEIPDNSEALQGAVILDDVIVLTFENSLYLITEQGELVEKITGVQSLPTTLQSVGLDNSGKIIIRAAGAVLYSDANMEVWKPYPGNNVNWSVSENLPESMEKNLVRLYRGRGLSLERAVADLHSGRIFGSMGIYLIDISGIIFIVLTGTGWWLWFKRRALQKEINGEL